MMCKNICSNPIALTKRKSCQFLIAEETGKIPHCPVETLMLSHHVVYTEEKEVRKCGDIVKLGKLCYFRLQRMRYIHNASTFGTFLGRYRELDENDISYSRL